MIQRLAKILLVLMMAIYLLLVGIDNLLDYGSNFAFVQHVMSMGLIAPDNPLIGRAITDPTAHHVVYALIIAAELGAGLLCAIGVLQLFTARRASAARFAARKTIAIAGLMLAIALYFFGFMTIAAEWFQMWQASSFNGQQAAFRLIVCFGIALIFLCLPERELDEAGRPH
jgi:predicted small integral membrane protein